MKNKIFIIIPIFIFILSNFNYAQKVHFSIDTGLSLFTGEGSEYWNPGFSIGGNIFFPLSKNILLGGRIAYSRWTPDVFELTREYTGLGIQWDILGSATVLDITPIIRGLIPLDERKTSNLLLQAGAGLFVINLKARVGGRFLWLYVEERIDESDTKFGILLGGGLVIGKLKKIRFEIFPLFHITFNEKTTKYFTINAGIGF